MLLAEKTLQGEMEATLNYWNICAWLEAKGFRRVLGIEDVLPKLGASGRTAMLGYVFDEAWAAKHADVVSRFLDVTRKAKEILATSDAEWVRIAPLVSADASALAIYRDRYREGIPRRPVEAEEADARTLFRVLAKQGGASLVGHATALDPGTFFRPRSGS
jgi:NitT/TauT family transport system substrate-binding protein